MFDYEKEHLDRLYSYLGECTLFLKRDNSFPISKPCKIAAYGCGVRGTIKGGSGSGEVNDRNFVNIEQGLINKGFTIINNSWLDELDKLKASLFKKWIKQIKKDAKKDRYFGPNYALGKVMAEPEYEFPLSLDGEVAIYVVSRLSGEGSDREVIKGSILLTDSEIRDIKYLNATYKKFMLVINAGGYVDLSQVSEVNNILVLSELGAQTGNVLADILVGKINPSGKLTNTWANLNDYPYSLIEDNDDTFYNEGRYVGYRYFDSYNIKPMFPFGFGLSYSNFKIDNISISNNKEIITVTADITNISQYDGKEALEVYISTNNSYCYQELIGFNKSDVIKPNQTQKVKVDFNLKNIAKYDQNREVYYLPKTSYIVRVGNSSDNTVEAGVIILDEEVIIKQCKNIFNNLDVQEKNITISFKIPSNIIEIHLNSKDFNIIQPRYEEVTVNDEIKKLSLEELIFINNGLFAKEKAYQTVGNSAKVTPGAAGQVSNEAARLLNNKVVMSDGPAGLRLIPEYFYKGNKILYVKPDPFLAFVLKFLPLPLYLLVKTIMLRDHKPDKNAKIYYQYCTSLPIATGIAQSFNVELAKVCGDIVGDEMERFNVDLWLAPAMNIQRTIMCGRNYEYFSEDPYLTGIFASYISKGVQLHKGRDVVIKHFAANNQEKRRLTNNSVLSETTLREIYLRGFEIAIENSNPKAIMSSYNLINGQHATENKNLIYDYLYKENGFKGIVMTDWLFHQGLVKNPKYPQNDSTNIFLTGTSLIMPGSKIDYQGMYNYVINHPEARNILEENAMRLYLNFKK